MRMLNLRFILIKQVRISEVRSIHTKTFTSHPSCPEMILSEYISVFRTILLYSLLFYHNQTA